MLVQVNFFDSHNAIPHSSCTLSFSRIILSVLAVAISVQELPPECIITFNSYIPAHCSYIFTILPDSPIQDNTKTTESSTVHFISTL